MTVRFHARAASLFGAAIFFSALGFSSPASALFEDDEARVAILQLRGQIDQLSKRIADLERQLNLRSAEQDRQLSAKAGDIEKQLQATSQGQLQVLNEIERLRAEVARLRGSIEETSRVASTGKSQQKDLYVDLDQRLKKLEPVTVTADGIAYRVSQEEKSKHDELRDLLRAGDFKKATSVAEAFELTFPSSALAANVLLSKGTAFYGERNYKAAIVARQEFIEKYPNHPARPDATLNLAASQAEAGNATAARATLEGLVKAYPNSAAASEARERLKAAAKAAAASAPAPAKATAKGTPTK